MSSPIDFVQHELKQLDNKEEEVKETVFKMKKSTSLRTENKYGGDDNESDDDNENENKYGDEETNELDGNDDNNDNNDEELNESDEDDEDDEDEDNESDDNDEEESIYQKEPVTYKALKKKKPIRKRPVTIKQVVKRIKKKKTKDNPRNMAYKLLLTFLRNNYDEKKGREIFNKVKKIEKDNDENYKKKYNFIINYITQLIHMLEKNPNLDIKKSYLEDNPQYKYYKSQLEETKKNITDVKTQKSLVKCRRCGSNENINKMAKQTRAGDEPASIIITCGDCGYQWQGDF